MALLRFACVGLWDRVNLKCANVDRHKIIFLKCGRAKIFKTFWVGLSVGFVAGQCQVAAKLSGYFFSSRRFLESRKFNFLVVRSLEAVVKYACW